MGCSTSRVVTTRNCIVPRVPWNCSAGFIPIPLSPEKKKLIRESWILVEPVKVAAGKKLFARLFEINPKLQDTFPAFKGLELQDVLNSRSLFLHAGRVMKAVENAVSSLDDSETFTSYLVNLGIRHLPWDVTKGQFNTVGEALLWTLQDMLGSACTTETAEAWGELYGFIVESMLYGIQEAKTTR